MKNPSLNKFRAPIRRKRACFDVKYLKKCFDEIFNESEMKRNVCDERIPVSDKYKTYLSGIIERYK